MGCLLFHTCYNVIYLNGCFSSIAAILTVCGLTYRKMSEVSVRLKQYQNVPLRQAGENTDLKKASFIRMELPIFQSLTALDAFSDGLVREDEEMIRKRAEIVSEQ